MRFLTILFLITFSLSRVSAQEYLLKSPDGTIKVEILVSANTIYRIYLHNKLIAHGKPIALTVGKKNKLGYKEYSPTTETSSVDRTVTPIVASKSAKITENYNQLTLDFESGLGIDFRCFDDGFAYRLRTSFENELIIKEESMGFELTTNPNVWFPKESSFYSHNEREFIPTTSMDLKKGNKASLPVLWKWDNGPFLLYTETDLHDYPGMYLQTNGLGGYTGIHPTHPAAEFKAFDRYAMSSFKNEWIAKTEGTRSYPWRVFCIADDEEELMATQLPWLLASESKLALTDWIQPGKVAWDWWNALQLEGVDFKPGLNTETYKYYIDFAAANNLQYIIMDEGWYKLGNLTKVKKEINMPELIEYASKKNVGVILWMAWRTLDEQFDVAFQQFSDWGVAGIKVDFMLRSDQVMTQFYERVAQEAANRLMLVDFHGSHCPKGLQRTYPNVLTYEGVRGLEWNKWSSALTVDHDVTLPFTRMVAGPMDYTPGAMKNISNPKKHHMSFKHPKSMGTRCHELSKYVIFESPLQMLADAPTSYEKEAECMKFLSAVPTTWDETIVLDAKVAEHVVLARRKGNDWYIGAMTGSLGQTISLDFSFLGNGQFEMELWRDGDNTRTDGTSFEYFKEESINSTMKYIISMAEGGGWVGIVRKK